MESELPFGYTHGREKRSAAQMDLDGSASPTWSHIDRLSVSREPSAPRTHAPAVHLRHPSEMPAGNPERFQGDGYDFRRPVVSSNVIDLTDEDAGPSMAPSRPQRSSGRSTRLPRFGREIIDVEEEDTGRTAEPPDSPEIQFVSSRPVQPRSLFSPSDPEGGDEDEVEFLRANPLPESRRRRQIELDDITNLLNNPAYRERVAHIREEVERRTERRRGRDAQIARMERMFAEARSRTTPRPLGARRISVSIPEIRRRDGHRTTFHVGFIAPNLNFGAVGFDMGYEDDTPDAAPPPAPTYDAPAQAPGGFTRSPQEEDVLVCPNCDDELCTGDSDLKRQVWLVKACGHVYCGECKNNRSAKKSAKGKEKQAPARTKPFKECVVEGCQKKVSTKSAFIQIFL